MLDEGLEATLKRHGLFRLLQVDYVEVELRDHRVDKGQEVSLIVGSVEEHISDVVLATQLRQGLQVMKDHWVPANCEGENAQS